MDDSLIVSSGALLVCFSDPRPQAVPCEPGTKTWEPTAGRFLSRGRRCDIIGRSHKARHLSTSTWCIHPAGPGSCLHLTRGSKSLLTAALATTVNVERRNNLTSKRGAQEVYQVQVVGITRS